MLDHAREGEPFVNYNEVQIGSDKNAGQDEVRILASKTTRRGNRRAISRIVNGLWMWMWPTRSS